MPQSEIFMENYRTCCNDSKTRVKVKSLGQNKCLEFNPDRLEEQDWQPLLKALKYDRRLHTLSVKSQYQRKRDARQRRCWVGEQDQPSFHKASIIDQLTESIVACMKCSDILSTLQLQGIPLQQRHVERLAEGIHECQSLQYLVLARFDLLDQGLAALYDSVYTHVHLNTIDMSDCGLTDQGAEIIAKIIRTQRLARYDETWKQSLRYRKPDGDLVPGIRRITLNDNPGIGDKGFHTIIHELMDDLWIKALDFQNCGLTDASGIESLDLISLNDTITILDLSRNDKIPMARKKEVKRWLAEKAYREVAADKPGYTHSYEWLEGASEITRTGTSIKPNSELSIRPDIFSRQKKNRSISPSQLSVELHQTKRDLDDTKRQMIKEREKREQLERERKEQKAMLDQRFTKEWKKRKQVEKERDKLKMELNVFISEGHIPKKLTKSSSTSSGDSKASKPKRKKPKAKPEKALLASASYHPAEKPARSQVVRRTANKSKTPKKPFEKKRTQVGYEVANTHQLHIMQRNLDRLNFNKPETNNKTSSGSGSESSCCDSEEQDEPNLSEPEDVPVQEPVAAQVVEERPDRPAQRDPRTLSPMSRSQWIFNKIMSSKYKDNRNPPSGASCSGQQNICNDSNVKWNVQA